MGDEADERLRCARGSARSIEQVCRFCLGSMIQQTSCERAHVHRVGNDEQLRDGMGCLYDVFQKGRKVYG